MARKKLDLIYTRRRRDGDFTYYEKISEDVLLGGALRSIPPAGKCRVTNLYVDPLTEKMIVEWDDDPE